MTTTPRLPFAHLVSMSDARGVFEHALLDAPRPEHGYCTDDMARVLVVTAREPGMDEHAIRLRALSLTFLTSAQGEDGGSRNRMNRHGTWTDEPTFLDCWGRSLWGLGTAASRLTDDDLRLTALDGFSLGATGRSPWLRAMVFAGLGAAEVLTTDPDHLAARQLLGDAAARVGDPVDPAWPWPESRLAYANAAIPEVLIAAGNLLDRPDFLERGLAMLAWLVEEETLDGHLSVTPVDGRARGGPKPAFDQQPIEVAAIADACARAAAVDRDECWTRSLELATAWFEGRNDADAPMWDKATGGGYDGLHVDGPNRNQGAESTLAALSTLQHAQRPVVASP